MRRFAKAAWMLIGAVGLAVWISASMTDAFTPPRDGPLPPDVVARIVNDGPIFTLPPEVTVARVVDGDTIVIEDDAGKRRSIRLVGVDTPEVVHPTKPVQPYGPEASAYAKKRLTGKKVRLVPDLLSGPTDRYGRGLAYVFIGDECFNETLIREGYGRTYLKYHFEPATRTRFLIAEEAAMRERRGLWGLMPQ